MDCIELDAYSNRHNDDGGPEALRRTARKYEESRGIVCRYCKKTGLTWGRSQEKWRLFEEGDALHTCVKTD